jgi:hypothetical protein
MKNIQILYKVENAYNFWLEEGYIWILIGAILAISIIFKPTNNLEIENIINIILTYSTSLILFITTMLILEITEKEK